ncbi:MAG: hypothetical protein Q4P34_08555 [Tissierellia bacterium]|nr:hypothetical protein [Tissierellia bacterium]
MPKKIIDDTINFGLGLFHYSKDKIEQLVDEMVDRGEVAKEDAKNLIDDLVSKGEKEKLELTKIVKDNIKNSIDMSQYVRKDEIKSIIRDELKNILTDKDE